MEKLPLISVVMPVYNVSDYIEQCLKSLMNQTYQNLEILVIDDCGTDDSIVKAEALAAQDERIHIIYNPGNQGVAESRNNGIANAHGEFLAFIDSDDWVAPDFYEKLYQAMQEQDADIAVGDTVYWYSEKNQTSGWVSDFNFKTNKKVVSTPEDKQYNLYACAIWDKLYKTKLFKKYNITYPVGMRLEDMSINAIITILAKRIALVKEAKLYYRQNENGFMSNSSSNRSVFDIFRSYDYADKVIAELPIEKSEMDVYRQIMDNFKIFNIYGWYTATNQIYKDEFYNIMRDHFQKIDVTNNKFITKDTLKKYKQVTSKDRIRGMTILKLFNFVPLFHRYIYEKKSYTYLFDMILLDKMVHKKHIKRHYLLGFIPYLSIKEGN